jgi:hypothetical protein
VPLVELTETGMFLEVVTVTVTGPPWGFDADTPVIAPPSTFPITATMLLNMLPMAGPSIARMIMTTIATNTRIRAYSTNPCPLLPVRIFLIIVRPPCIIKAVRMIFGADDRYLARVIEPIECRLRGRAPCRRYRTALPSPALYKREQPATDDG